MMKYTGKYTGCFLAVLGLLASGSVPAIAAVSPSSYGNSRTSILHDGMVAGLRFTVPFGGKRVGAPEPRLALGLDFYRSQTPTGDPFNAVANRVSLTSMDFSQRGFERLSIANRTALTTTYDPVNGRRLDFFAPTPSTLLWGAVVVGAAVGVFLLVDGSNNTDTETPAQ